MIAYNKDNKDKTDPVKYVHRLDPVDKASDRKMKEIL